VGDETRYDTQRYVPTWPARYIDQGSTGPLSALAVNDGFARYPTKDDREVALEAAADPAANAAAVLTRRLEARGVSVVGAPRSGRAPAGGVEVAAVASPPLLDVVGQLLRESDNDTGEMLLKELGRVAGQATTSGGARRLAGLLDDGTVDLTGLQVVDGSGLSVDNRVTCDLLVDVLGRAGTGELLTDLLPVAGESGTLERRFADTPLAGVLRAKTGSLRAVSALAGFVTDDDPALTFAVVANVPDGTTLPVAVDGVEARVAEVLASWPRTPDVSVLGPQEVGG
jgi:D-alanyl-D-alanine carboxypeptidase/D-alanyl-D-alanine-endopeptidase (penicillin-binding protein 4)